MKLLIIGLIIKLNTMNNIIPPEAFDKVKAELDEIEKTLIDIDGLPVKPSKCYYFGNNPAHILFNTNCPDQLKERVEGILLKYTSNENHSQAGNTK